ncbi:OmpA family protein [Hyphomicrobium sp.]|jgi:outer membrane protein OmpA-like peptidoglycan-associated protein|uniref:OmpA family protein n=1 Tax=Hyphomicrobium sp. TaxID=82 RepID=UPI0035696599
MKSSRHVALAAASLLAAVAVSPSLVKADDQQPQGKWGNKNDKKQEGKEQGGGDRNRQEGRPDKQHRERPQGNNQGNKEEKRGKPNFGQNPQPNVQPKQFGNGGQGGNPNAFVKPKPNFQPKPPVANDVVVPQKQQRPQNAGPQNFDNKFGGQNNDNNNNKNNDRNRGQFQKPFGGNDRNQAGQGKPPGAVGKPETLNRPASNFRPPNTPPLSASDSKRRFEALRGQRKEVKIDGGKGVVIEEPGKRRIYRENNRVMITHDDNERLRRVSPNARFEKGKGGGNIAVIDRPGGYKVYSETDSHGQLVRRYRRGPDGRDVIIIDNRRRRHDNFGRNLAAGIGIGVGVVAGAAILNSVLDVPPPRVTIPRDEYIVDYERASDEDVYDALSAPPVEDFRDRYTLDEIRATAALRDRMRRVDLDDITFDFGSWDVNPIQYGKLERIARAMRRIIERNPNEVFMIEGYTDAVGSPEDNLSLSDRRAESVAEVLSEQFQIPFENLTTQGYGEDYLKVPTQAPERLNRRVAVRRITPLLARDNGPPPPAPRPGDRQPAYDDGPGGGPDDGGPVDDQGDDRGNDDRQN